MHSQRLEWITEREALRRRSVEAAFQRMINKLVAEWK